MSQEKIEAIVLTDDGIMIQEITFMRSTSYQPVIRVPTVEEVIKVADGCKATIDNMAKAEADKETAHKLLDVVFEGFVEKFGRKNVEIDGRGGIVVIDNGKSHRIWVE